MPVNYLSLPLAVVMSAFLLVACQAASEKPKEPPSTVGSTATVVDKAPAYEVEFTEDFQQGILSQRSWILTEQNDFRQSIIDVIDVGQNDLRLSLLANTIGTMGDTVKFHGVRTVRKIDFAEGKIISFDLDWNDQANGSYLTAGLYLCPVATDINPRDELDWIAVEYIGVPPGKNARLQVASAKKGNLRFLFTEGWPDKQRTGRKIANQHVELVIDDDSLKVLEKGEELFSTGNHGLNFSQAYLYLQMSSHSNYPSREVYFDNIVVK
ncbi:hypothetical protein ACFLWS_07430 [Chloroflexota bacterium]